MRLSLTEAELAVLRSLLDGDDHYALQAEKAFRSLYKKAYPESDGRAK